MHGAPQSAERLARSGGVTYRRSGYTSFQGHRQRLLDWTQRGLNPTRSVVPSRSTCHAVKSTPSTESPACAPGVHVARQMRTRHNCVAVPDSGCGLSAIRADDASEHGGKEVRDRYAHHCGSCGNWSPGPWWPATASAADRLHAN